MQKRKRSFWAWGFEDRLPTASEQDRLVKTAGALLPTTNLARRPLPDAGDLRLSTPRISPPSKLDIICSTAATDRAGHCYGRGYPDLVRGICGDFRNAPDFVAFPESEEQLSRLFEWCEARSAAAIPYGGGTSVVAGIEARDLGSHAGAVSIDLSRMSGVREVDRTSLRARIGAGTSGPAIEEQLAAHDLTLRHFPQSFELSTLGGWLATRAGGHFATRYTHIDDLTEAIRMVTPKGVWQSLAVPASGAGPSPDRWVLGSEGTLGVIVEAWMRVRPKPKFRSSASIRFAKLAHGVEATRALAQSRLYPDGCRLLDSREALLHRVAMDLSNVLILGFEAADEPVRQLMDAAVELARDHGGELLGEIVDRTPALEGDGEERAKAADAWRAAFIDAPYLLNTAVSAGLIVDTFETSVTWSQFLELHGAVVAAAEDVCRRECGGGFVTMRFTHVYPDGPAPYYTVIAPGRRGGELEQWRAIKSAVTDAMCAAGGTVTHHHAVGRVHRPWYDKQRPALFADALRAAKKAVDPHGILNPGVLLAP